MTDLHTNSEPVRIDIWLWAARFYKTRSLAAAAVVAGHVTVNEQRCKRGKTIKPGDTVCVNRASEMTEVEVLQLSLRRGPAPQAQSLYRETKESRARADLLVAQRMAGLARSPAPGVRPTKRDRRVLDDWTRGEHG